MKSHIRLACQMSAASGLVLAACGGGDRGAVGGHDEAIDPGRGPGVVAARETNASASARRGRRQGCVGSG